MSEKHSSSTDSGKPSGQSRDRSFSNASRRGPSGRPQPQPPSFQPHVGGYQALNRPEPNSAPQGFLHGQYQSQQTPFAQGGPYLGGQYTMSPPPAPANIVHQQSGPQYAYPNRPGLHSPDTSIHPQNHLMGYSTNAMLPMMQPHTPVYAYPGQYPEGSSSSSHSFSGSPGVSSTLYSPIHTSPTSHSPLVPQGSSPYAPRYPTPPFVYPAHSFGHSGNTLYPAQHSYGQQYRPTTTVPAEQEGTWWYMPPGAGPPPSSYHDAYLNPYAMYGPATPRDIEYGTSPPSAPSSGPPSTYIMPPHQNPSPFTLTQPHRSPAPDPPPPPIRDPPMRSRSEPGKSDVTPSSPVMGRATGERSAVRRPYHPNPPANRSEWVMWAGNVPSDATHDELWRFFNSSPSPLSSSSVRPLPLPNTSIASVDSVYGGVSSVFLIQRSNCAFINFQSEEHLQAAINHFNGQPLRVSDSRCPRLVCRVRAREDDLKAGVGGQRGSGIHVRWIKDQRQGVQERASATGSPEQSSSERSITTPSTSPSDAAPLMASLSLSSDDEAHVRRIRRPMPHSSSSGSFASTNSSLLSQYFPKRYFILKSLTQFDLDLSVEKGLWATQRHNEGILDQAYRTSKEVYFIFGVNKSGEFYGYARYGTGISIRQTSER
ncbi:hypothetical protein PHLCEN_2v3639 [Hermanssonia centrifuga]|uniref:YTH domain-containing protein n=1 Tax=Hermanssonia centrifuga TaxID=98765 RepID=A0A2R6QEP2_9APHY|nr:hypothetical protein PHLCEN_2v3639 [Hermanssonia centrifuga]